MNRRNLFSLALGALALASLPAFAVTTLPQVELFKSPQCGCCGKWVDHMKAAGFPVRVTLVQDVTAVRKRFSMPDRFASCHTAMVNGYVVEGHVPAEEIKRVLAAKPNAIGLAVPSMPPGSPGMEAGSRVDPYDVFLIDKNGGETVFARYPKS
jgi:hypothetical protein